MSFSQSGTRSGNWSAPVTVDAENDLYSLNEMAPAHNGLITDLAYTSGEFQQPPYQENTCGSTSCDAAGGNLPFKAAKVDGTIVYVPWALQPET